MVLSALSTKDSRPQEASKKTRKRDVIQSNSVNSNNVNAPEKLLNQDKLLNIALNAYYKSEARGFELGHEIQDWLEAEAEVAQ